MVPSGLASPPAHPQPPRREQRQHCEGQQLIFSLGKAGAREQPSRLLPLARGALLLLLPLLKRVPRASARPAAPPRLCSGGFSPRLASLTSPIPPPARILPLPREEEEDARITPGASGCCSPTADGSGLFTAP